MTQEIGYYAGGGMSYRREYEYDGHGNQVKQVYYNAEGQLMYYEAYEYTYDEDGHIVKMISRDFNGHVEHSFEITEFATVQITRAQAEYIWAGFAPGSEQFFERIDGE